MRAFVPRLLSRLGGITVLGLLCGAGVLTGPVGAIPARAASDVAPAGGVAPASSADRTLRLEALEVQPDEAGLRRALENLLELRAGDRVDANTLLSARRRLIASGWFEEVEVYTRRGSRPGAVVLRVEGELDDGVHLETGFAHDPLENWTLRVVGLRAHHVLGPASTARLGWTVGPRRSGIDGDLLARQLGGQSFDLFLRFSGGEYRWDAFDDVRLYHQQVERSEGALGLRVHLGRGWTVSGWIGGSSAKLRAPEQAEGERAEAPAFLRASVGSQQNFSDAGAEITYDRRDGAEPWRRGLWATVQARGSSTDGGPDFARARAALRTAVPLPGGQALALRLDGEWSDPQTPYYLRPVFGGESSVRGFRYASLSGALGARSTASASLEWRAPLLGAASDDPRLHGVLFLDTGTFVGGDGQTHDLSTSVGWGLRWRLPWVDRLSIDVGIPLTPTSTDDPFWVHAGLGFGF